MAWWEYLEPTFDFSLMESGGGNAKWIYYGLGGPGPARTAVVISDGSQWLTDAYGGVAGVNGSTPASHLYDNLLLPFGGGWNSRGIEWVVNYPVPVGRWYLVEIMDKLNSAPGVQDGWNEMRIDNQTIYQATNMAQAKTSDTKPCFYDLRFGGNYGWVGGSQVQYRYYGDMYVDGTLQRVALGDSSVYGKCKHIELQIPQTWSGTGISIVFNQGTFSNAQTAYLFVIDSSNNASPGYPLAIGGTTGISVPDDKSTNGTICFRIAEQNGNFKIGANEAIRRIDITDVMGKIIYSSNPGANNFVWLQQDNTGRMVSRGIYFVRLIGSKSVQCKRVVLLR